MPNLNKNLFYNRMPAKCIVNEVVCTNFSILKGSKDLESESYSFIGKKYKNLVEKFLPTCFSLPANQLRPHSGIINTTGSYNFQLIVSYVMQHEVLPVKVTLNEFLIQIFQKNCCNKCDKRRSKLKFLNFFIRINSRDFF